MEDREKHFVGNVAQKAIIEKDGKILVVRGNGDTLWEFPGGRLHEGETPREGVEREVREELGVSIQVGQPVDLIRSFHNQSKQWQVFTAYICFLNDNAEVVIDRSELEDYKWISRGELKELPMFEDCKAVANTFLESH